MHHAYLLVGERTASLEHIDEGDRVPGPDVSVYAFDRFGIDEARSLRHESSLMPVTRPYRVFIISFATITTEAQNALLKLFEDPVDTVRFYLITADADMLIPTLRSRFMELSGRTMDAIRSEVADNFLRSTYDKRLQDIAEHMKGKDVLWAEELLRGLEVWIQHKSEPTVLRDLVFVRTYDRTRSASRKMLLEHLALTLPVV
jgi:hypothetical protein